MDDQKEIVDQGTVGFVETMPRYRVNAKQLANGTWVTDVTVELRTPTAAWPDASRPSGDVQMGAPEIWDRLRSDLVARIKAKGGKLAEDQPPKGR